MPHEGNTSENANHSGEVEESKSNGLDGGKNSMGELGPNEILSSEHTSILTTTQESSQAENKEQLPKEESDEGEMIHESYDDSKLANLAPSVSLPSEGVQEVAQVPTPAAPGKAGGQGQADDSEFNQ